MTFILGLIMYHFQRVLGKLYNLVVVFVCLSVKPSFGVV